MALDSRIYDINFKKLAKTLTPALLFKPVQIVLLYACVTPITWVYNQFMAFKRFVEYRLSITPQVCYLEKALNDRYDLVDRRIYIVDAVEYDALPLYLKVESKHLVLPLKTDGHLVLYTKGETGIYTVDFIVMVPSVIALDFIEMRAVINGYKLLSKKFQIKTF
jgi:hypothetical protein